ncbi:MAG TPA: HNH endonuclease [Cyanobacteria bacterium UBA8553]|nr:HNH endonuclease [Cyanobacteria bacterium UBA8553]HAJ64883.1 HNH endonuclease [Cyanobacteria bacterium UBA8543]
MIHSPFKELVKNLFEATKQVDTALGELKEVSTKINAKYDPRSEFIRWRDSKDGQFWKQKQYQIQSKRCASCQKRIQLKGSHIDHVEPLSLYPHLALETKNLRLTCPDCNISKGNK